MDIEKLIEQLKKFDHKSRVIIEIAGTDRQIDEIYEDGKGDICIYSKEPIIDI